MKNMQKKQSAVRKLAQRLAKRGYKFFSVDDVRYVIEKDSIPINNIKNALLRLSLQGWIHSVKKNLYVLDSSLMSGTPVHEFEIAINISKPSAISHYSAFYVHELTEQIPLIVYASVPTGTSLSYVPKGKYFTFRGVRYKFIQVKKDSFFGIEKIWRGSSKIFVTDLERTLLDGLAKPKYCGGFMDVLHGFTVKDFDVDKMVRYAKKLDVSVAKRLGWVLESIGYTGKMLKLLEAIPLKGFTPLDASREKSGPYNKKWQVRENIR